MSHLRKQSAALAMFLALASVSVFAGAPSKTGPAGTWQIVGKDSTKSVWRGTLVLAGDKQLTGHIDWTATGGDSNGASGREIVKATFDAKDRTLTIKGERLEKANNIILATYTAKLSDDGRRLTDGTWSSDEGTGWSATRAGEEAVAKETPKDAPKDPKKGGYLPNPKKGFVHKKFELPDGENADYWLFVPHNYTPTKAFPLIVFLHGSGETKGGNKSPVDVGLGEHIGRNENGFGYLTIFPQAQEEGWRPKGINGQLLYGVIDKTMKQYHVDEDRVVLTGLSMGGIGTWVNAVYAPDRWAAIVPVCGHGNPDRAERIKDIPCWAFHGGADPIINVSGTTDMIAALKKAGGRPRQTIYPNVGHVCWNQAYDTPALWKWLGEQKRK